MKPFLILLLLIPLSACATSSASIKSADLPPSLLVPCAQGVLLPERDLTRGETERFWLEDRLALRECRTRHGGLVAAVQAAP